MPAKLLHSRAPLVAAADLAGLVGLEAVGALDPPLLREVHFPLVDRHLLLVEAITAHCARLPLSRTQIIASSLHLSACPSPIQRTSLVPLCMCMHPPESRTGTCAPQPPLSCAAQSPIPCSARAAQDKHACMRILESMTGISFVSLTHRQRLLLLCMGGRAACFLNAMFPCNESWQSKQRLKYAICLFKAHRASIPCMV